MPRSIAEPPRHAGASISGQLVGAVGSLDPIERHLLGRRSGESPAVPALGGAGRLEERGAWRSGAALFEGSQRGPASGAGVCLSWRPTQARLRCLALPVPGAEGCLRLPWLSPSSDFAGCFLGLQPPQTSPPILFRLRRML